MVTVYANGIDQIITHRIAHSAVSHEVKEDVNYFVVRCSMEGSIVEKIITRFLFIFFFF